MSLAWPWQPQPRPHHLGSWLVGRWLALLRPQHPTPIEGASPASHAASTVDQRAAFEAFFLRYGRPVTGYLWRMTGDEQLASELAQETFLRAWEHFESISRYEQPLSWLFRVGTNLARQQHRRQRSQPGGAISLESGGDPAISDPAMHFIEQDLVRQTLLQLTFQQRASLILCEVYGLSCAEAGAMLHLSRDAVKMSLFRAREQFRARYLREDEGAQ